MLLDGILRLWRGVSNREFLDIPYLAWNMTRPSQ